MVPCRTGSNKTKFQDREMEVETKPHSEQRRNMQLIPSRKAKVNCLQWIVTVCINRNAVYLSYPGVFGEHKTNSKVIYLRNGLLINFCLAWVFESLFVLLCLEIQDKAEWVEIWGCSEICWYMMKTMKNISHWTN